jgi:outer membrane protein assembly factor BamB
VGRLVVVADDGGTVRALDAETGAHRWETSVGSAPAQAPQSTSLGLALALVTGEVVVLAPEGGAKRTLSEASPGRPTFAAPWDDGVLVVGGAGGLVHVDATGTSRRLGPASTVAVTGLVATPAGCAWTEDGGAVCWLDASSPERGPLKVAGSGAATRPPALAPGWLYSVGPDKVLRGVRLDSPERAAWTVSLPEAPVGGPVVFGDLVVVRTANGLLAYDR